MWNIVSYLEAISSKFLIVDPESDPQTRTSSLPPDIKADKHSVAFCSHQVNAKHFNLCCNLKSLQNQVMKCDIYIYSKTKMTWISLCSSLWRIILRTALKQTSYIAFITSPGEFCTKLRHTEIRNCKINTVFKSQNLYMNSSLRKSMQIHLPSVTLLPDLMTQLPSHQPALGAIRTTGA